MKCNQEGVNKKEVASNSAAMNRNLASVELGHNHGERRVIQETVTSSPHVRNRPIATLRHDDNLGATTATVWLYTNAESTPAQPQFAWRYYGNSATYQATTWEPYTGQDNYKWQLSVTLTATPNIAWPIGTDWNAQLVATVGTESGILNVKLIGATERYDFKPDSVDLTKT